MTTGKRGSAAPGASANPGASASAGRHGQPGPRARQGSGTGRANGTSRPNGGGQASANRAAGRSGRAGGPSRARATTTPPSRGERPGTRRARHWARVLAWLSTALAVLLFTLAAFPQLQSRWTPLALAASFSPYALGLWLLAVLLTLVAGRGAARWWAVAPAAGLLLQAFTLTPYLPRPAESEPDHLSVATVNLRFGEAELARAADTALFSSEVLVLTEATAANLTVIDSPAWRRRFPYRVGKVGRSNAGDPHGTLILSAYPLTELGEASGSRFLNVAARASTPQGDLVVVGAHPQNPMGGAAGWVYDGAALTRLVERERGGLPVVVAGDLNAIDEHLTVRELLARGLSDAAVQAGAGWLPTWPANRWYPPLIPIDHVLVSDGLTATALRTVEIPGTDHLGLVAELRRG